MTTKFTNRDYETILQQLKRHLAVTRPDLVSEFTDSALGQLLLEMLAVVGDIISYGQDAAVLEAFLSTCRRYESALLFAKCVGYKPRPMTAATVTVVSKGDSGVPSLLTLYGGTILAGSSITGENGLKYELLNDYIVTPGQNIIRVPLYEGSSHQETFPAILRKNYTITVSRGGVADKSWEVWVGNMNSLENRWSEVENVTVQSGPGKFYDVTFTDSGQLVIRFGDGASGAIPEDTITVRYRTCNGSRGNAAARTIKGTLLARVADNNGSIVPVPFENYEVGSLVGTSTVFHEEMKSVPAQDGRRKIYFTLSNYPILGESVQLTIMTGSANQLVLVDLGTGAFQVVTNVGYILDQEMSRISYNSGSVTIVLSNSGPAFDSDYVNVVARYRYFNAYDPYNVTVSGAAVGGQDQESLEELKVNIPAYIRSQNRLVTADDYRALLRKIPGVDLVYADLMPDSYTTNMIRVFSWAKEVASLPVYNQSGSYVSVPYQRYARISGQTISEIQKFVRRYGMMTVRHAVYRPEVLWVDVYFSPIRYDRRYNADKLRQEIGRAVAKVAESGTGFSLRMAHITDAVKNIPGVLWFSIERFALGYSASEVNEYVIGEVSGSNATNFSGTLPLPVRYNSTDPNARGIISPFSVILIFRHDSGDVVFVDDGRGKFISKSFFHGLSSSSINYQTGAFSLTLINDPNNNKLPLKNGSVCYASFSDIIADYRLSQKVSTQYSIVPEELQDKYPPPSSGVINRRYVDGLPVSSDSSYNHYESLRDIVIEALEGGLNYYDNTYLYNNEITYSSSLGLNTDVRSINIRKVVFHMISQ